MNCAGAPRAMRSSLPDTESGGARPRVSIVIPTYNRCDMLREAVLSVLRQGPAISYEIVVIDNASTDDTGGVLAALAAGATVPLRSLREAEPGDAHARNRGVEESAGEWIAFLDDDEIADSDWLSHLTRAAAECGAAVVGGAVKLDLPPARRERLGRLCRRALRETEERCAAVHRYTGNVLPSTANLLVHRSVFETVGRFDTGLVSGCSDSDFVMRARKAGYALWHAPTAVVHHRIPLDRLDAKYFRWDAHRDGVSLALLDARHRGMLATALICLGRIAHACAVHVPLLAIAELSGSEFGGLGRRTRIWRAVGYVRKCLHLAAPRLFRQERFFAPLTLRKRAGPSGSAGQSSGAGGENG